MKWTKPKLHDLNDLKRIVAQGACSAGGLHQPICATGGTADPDCVNGLEVGGGGGVAECSGGSAVT